MEYKKIAAQMLGVDDYGILHYDFAAYLDDVARLSYSVREGELFSRQAIALAIVTWQRMNPSQDIIGKG